MANNNNNNNKKKPNNNKKPQKSTSDTLNENAALRLKIFIEDLRHDPMFRHRLFYPVMYKEVIRGNQYTKFDKDKPKEVKSSVSQVIYEYYLLKMEKFSKDDAARIFQAILYSNGPMLPVDDRLYMRDASDPRSILNPRNRDTVIKRTKMFLDVLQDETLFNFVFNETVGKNLDHMRTRFRDIANKMQNNHGANIADQQISQKNTNQNINNFRNYFAHVSDRDITEVVNFLTYMGNPRNVVTDFSYRPMSQNALDNYLSYNTDEASIANDEFRSQLEQALDSNILQKDLSSQLDIFIPMVLKEYTAICKDDTSNICDTMKTFSNDIRLPNELVNNLKIKIQRSMKQIHDYTRNYLTRKLLDDHYNNNNELFISRILNNMIIGLSNNYIKLSDLIRINITYSQFTGSARDDLSDLIKNIFENDVLYINEICTDTTNCGQTKDSFAYNWGTSKGQKPEDIALNTYKQEIDIRIFKKISTCMKFTNDQAKRLKSDIIDFIKKEKIAINYANVFTRAETDFNDNVVNEFRKMTSATAAERIAASIDTLIGNSFRTFISTLSKKSTDPIEMVLYVLKINELIEKEMFTMRNKINLVTSLDDFYPLMLQLKALKNTSETVLLNIHAYEKDIKDAFKSYKKVKDIMPNNIKKYFNDVEKCFDELSRIGGLINKSKDPKDMIDNLIASASISSTNSNDINTGPIASHLLEVYFKYYLKPVLVNFFGYALDNFEYTTRKNDIDSDIVSKDVLHFSKLLTPRNVGLLTIDGAVIHDIAKFTYILTSDQFTGVTYNNPDSVMKFLDDVYGLKYFNIVIYGRQDAYLYLNNVGVPYLYRGAKTKIPIRELRRNYDFLMDPATGLYKNIKLPKQKH